MGSALPSPKPAETPGRSRSISKPGRKWWHRLTFRIGVAVLLVEIATLTLMGFYYTRRFGQELEREQQERTRLPAKLISLGYLNFDLTSNREVMREMVGGEVERAIVFAVNGEVLHPPGLQTNAFSLLGLTPESLQQVRRDGVVRPRGEYWECLVPYAAGADGAPFLYTYVKSGPWKTDLRKREIAMQFLWGGAFTVGLTSLAIVLLLSRWVTRRVRLVLQAVEGLAKGDFSARVPSFRAGDEIGELGVGVNTMGDELQELFGQLNQRIEELKQARSELEKTEDRLRHAEKMKAIGQLAGGVAHDFNNLLQAILGYAHLVYDSCAPGDARRQDLDELIVAANRAAKLVKELLLFARPQTSASRIIRLNEVVGRVTTLMKPLIGEQIQLGLRLEADPSNILADPSQIEQVLMNLCVNARDAMPDGGKITIRTRCQEPQADFLQAHPETRPCCYVVLEVSDSGVGIPKEVQSHMFEPFFTTKAVGKGTGLGLATVYGVVKQHDGIIEVESAPGRGALFRIWFPAASGAAEPITQKVESSPVVQGRGTVLVAEDDQAVLDLAVRVLSQAGYHTLVARNGDEAVRLFESHGAVDLAILDVIMPGKSGAAVCQMLRARRPHLPVLFATGYDQNRLGPDLRDAPYTKVMNKPFIPSELIRSVQESLASVRKLNSLKTG